MNKKIVYVVIEINGNTNRCIKRDKKLAIIGTYEDLAAAEIKCNQNSNRCILSSEFHESIFSCDYHFPQNISNRFCDNRSHNDETSAMDVE